MYSRDTWSAAFERLPQKALAGTFPVTCEEGSFICLTGCYMPSKFPNVNPELGRQSGPVSGRS